MLMAHYKTAKNVSIVKKDDGDGDVCLLSQVINQVVLWDKIIKRGDSPIIDIKDIRFEYDFFDDGHGFL